MEQISTFVADAADDGARTPAPPSVDDLRARIVSVVLGQPGVFRLEPTLAGSRCAGGGLAGDGGCGVVLSLDDRTVGVEVDVSTRAGHQVLRTVSRLRAEVAGVVDLLGFTCTGVRVNVLSIEPVEEDS